MSEEAWRVKTQVNTLTWARFEHEQTTQQLFQRFFLCFLFLWFPGRLTPGVGVSRCFYLLLLQCALKKTKTNRPSLSCALFILWWMRYFFKINFYDVSRCTDGCFLQFKEHAVATFNILLNWGNFFCNSWFLACLLSFIREPSTNLKNVYSVQYPPFVTNTLKAKIYFIFSYFNMWRRE